MRVPVNREPLPPSRRERAPGEWIVRMVGHLVPWEERRTWSDEWEAELGNAWDDLPAGERTLLARLALTARTLGALPDALEIRSHNGRRNMLAHDIRFALRRLRFRPGFATLVTLTLALGIGAATTVFTVVDSVLLRPLPFAEPERLVELYSELDDGSGSGFSVPSVPVEALDELERRDDLFQGVARYMDRSLVLETGEPRELRAAAVATQFFPVLGVRPRIGRTFLPEDVESGVRVAVLSEGLWRDAMGGDPAVVGRDITLSGEQYTVVGVMPATFRYPRGSVSLWIPLSDHNPGTSASLIKRSSALARLAPGVEMPRAAAMAEQFTRSFEQEHPEIRKWELRLSAMGSWRANPDMRRALLILAGAVGCVLLIACGNAANLILVRTSNDRRSLSVRQALGATRGRVVRELLVEVGMLAACGGALGIAMAYGGVWVMRMLAPSELTTLSSAPITLDGRMLAVAVAMAMGTALLAGLAPALRATGRGVRFGSAERGGTGGVEQRRFRTALVVGELALSMMLLVGAGLLVHSFVRLLNVPPGMDVERLALVGLEPSAERYQDRATRAAFYDAVLERVRALPGVRAASVVGGVAGSGAGFYFSFAPEAEGADGPLPVSPEMLLPYGEADTSYFSTLGIPILDGRAFNTADMEPSARAVVIDERLARALWPAGRAVGRRVRLFADDEWRTVVGVSAAVRLMGPDDRDSPYSIYMPYPPGSPGQRHIAVRTAGDPTLLLPAIKAAIHAVDPYQPVRSATTAVDAYHEPLAKPRFLLVVMAFFATVAALLAAVGLYGVIAYTVSQRTREIGVRVALGAQARQIVSSVLAEGGRMALAGIALGVVAALVASRALEALLYGVSPTDPLTLAVVAVALGSITLFACWIPARRASKVDPMAALRSE